MKYCLSSRQPLSELKKADEIKVEFKDIDKIFDFITTLPDKTIILDIPSKLDVDNRIGVIDWVTIEMYSKQLKLVLCLHDLTIAKEAQSRNIPFYWAYKITSYWELRGIVDMKPCYLLLGAPLFFSLPKVKKITNIPIRAIPNWAHENYIPREQGICGQWIRPEDIELYEDYISVCEFHVPNLEVERTLFRIYSEDKSWPGNLNMLISNLNYDVDNRAIPEDIAKARIGCGLRCAEDGTCKVCPIGFAFADKVKQVHYELKKKELD